MVKKADKKGIDLKALIEKNDQLWMKKFENAKQEYEKKMAETESKFKLDLQEKTLLYEKESNELTEKHKQ